MKSSCLRPLLAFAAAILTTAARAADPVIAINVLLTPDQALIAKARAVNERLRGDYPAGYELDATHAPHVTLVQRFVRARDLTAVTGALKQVIAAERPAELRLKVKGYSHLIWDGRAVTFLVIERTPELMRLHQKVIDAVAPFSVSDGTAEAFVGAGINSETVGWVGGFVPQSSGERFNPHLTAGVAGEEFVKRMEEEPFEPYTVQATGIAVYQLGNFGTAAKPLWPSPDPLASWNVGAAKQAIIDFVEKVTKQGAPEFVPPAERIATFDNDGTLWAEQPMYFQFFFALDRVKALAPQHPEWKDKEPFASLLRGDVKAALAGGERALLEIMLATHTGNTTAEFEQIVTDWIATARHPVSKRPYTEMVYQPMLELLAYLRANDFKTFIVSGGGIEFMRPFTEKVYGVPPEQVVGSSVKTKFELRAGKPVLVRLPELDFVDDGEGKPVGINEHIGRRPIAAFGNSDGDLQMLQWTAAGAGARLCLFVHHDDAAREWAYDRESKIGRLDHGLDEAKARGWTVVSIKADWNQVFPPAK